MSVLDTLGVIQLFKHTSEKKRSVEEERIRSVLKYRRVFGTPEGKEVLAELLVRLGVGRSLTDEADRVRYNEAIFLLSRLGIQAYGKEFTNLLLSLPYEQETPIHEEEIG